MTGKETILFKLDELNIHYEVFNHEPIMTMEQGKDIERRMGVPAIKTLLMVNHQKQYFMVLLPAEKRLAR
jgi:Ala-tRNA(Pro) deacylase